jgi:hypothetical protein
MHPIIHDELKNARVADFHRQAERDRLARAFILARRTRGEHGKDPVGGRSAGVFARRLLIILGARSA